jgi:hypothetical protein
MRDPCWLYWPYELLTSFLIAWLWLLLFFGFRIQGRVILLGMALLAAWLWLSGAHEHYAAPEAGSVGRLRQLNAAMVDYKSEHQSYPEKLPNLSSSSLVDRYYRFELVASPSPDGKVVDYLIQATPRHLLRRIAQLCDCE